MLYSEFIEGTKAPQNEESYSQYKTIEKIYMDCEKMTKRDAYRLWKKTYGVEIKAKRAKMIDRASNLLCSSNVYEELPERDQRKISRELNDMFAKAFYCNDRTYTDEHGILWVIKIVSIAPNGNNIYGLFAIVDGEMKDAHLRKV